MNKPGSLSLKHFLEGAVEIYGIPLFHANTAGRTIDIVSSVFPKDAGFTPAVQLGMLVQLIFGFELREESEPLEIQVGYLEKRLGISGRCLLAPAAAQLLDSVQDWDQFAALPQLLMWRKSTQDQVEEISIQYSQKHRTLAWVVLWNSAAQSSLKTSFIKVDAPIETLVAKPDIKPLPEFELGEGASNSSAVAFLESAKAKVEHDSVSKGPPELSIDKIDKINKINKINEINEMPGSAPLDAEEDIAIDGDSADEIEQRLAGMPSEDDDDTILIKGITDHQNDDVEMVKGRRAGKSGKALNALSGEEPSLEESEDEALDFSSDSYEADEDDDSVTLNGVTFKTKEKKTMVKGGPKGPQSKKMGVYSGSGMDVEEDEEEIRFQGGASVEEEEDKVRLKGSQAKKKVAKKVVKPAKPADIDPITGKAIPGTEQAEEVVEEEVVFGSNSESDDNDSILVSGKKQQVIKKKVVRKNSSIPKIDPITGQPSSPVNADASDVEEDEIVFEGNSSAGEREFSLSIKGEKKKVVKKKVTRKDGSIVDQFVDSSSGVEVQIDSEQAAVIDEIEEVIIENVTEIKKEVVQKIKGQKPPIKKRTVKRVASAQAVDLKGRSAEQVQEVLEEIEVQEDAVTALASLVPEPIAKAIAAGKIDKKRAAELVAKVVKDPAVAEKIVEKVTVLPTAAAEEKRAEKEFVEAKAKAAKAIETSGEDAREDGSPYGVQELKSKIQNLEKMLANKANPGAEIDYFKKRNQELELQARKLESEKRDWQKDIKAREIAIAKKEELLERNLSAAQANKAAEDKKPDEVVVKASASENGKGEADKKGADKKDEKSPIGAEGATQGPSISTSGLDSIQNAVKSLRESIPDEKTRSALDALLSDLTVQKNQLNESAKQMNAELKRQEFQMNGKIQTALEEARQTKSVADQKQSQLDRMKELMTRLQAKHDETSFEAKKSNSELTQLKTVADTARRQLEEAKKEIERSKKEQAAKEGQAAVNPQVVRLQEQAKNTEKALLAKKQEVETLKRQLNEKMAIEAELRKQVTKLGGNAKAPVAAGKPPGSKAS